jgi:hypothetical protein
LIQSLMCSQEGLDEELGVAQQHVSLNSCARYPERVVWSRNALHAPESACYGAV